LARLFEKRAAVKLHSILLRNGCILPDRVDPLRVSCGNNWTHLEEIEAPAFDVMIRKAGWHFMWIADPCSRRGFGWTPEKATDRATTRALNGVGWRFNAAEFDSLRVTRYPGFCIANVTMQARQIQQNTALEIADAKHPWATPTSK
jgi:hypothetical protein